ncbi:MAG: protein-L-isoaspartate(D-aspartate) O-methyltransferase [Pseudomonadota bacterium]
MQEPPPQSGCHDGSEQAFAADRARLVAAIRRMTQDEDGFAPRAVSAQVLAVIGKVPRHRFVPREIRIEAYGNHPLPIGHGQTISQPYIVALMTDLLQLDKRQRVLEVGTGSGYQTAVLAELAGTVFSMEVVAPLAEMAAHTLHELGYGNVTVQAGDGAQGWPEHAPYDGILVTAAAEEVPPALLQQLRPGGRLVIPVGGRFEVQRLLRITRREAGGFEREYIEPVRFVPLV